jgi:hypothetical protein
VKVLVIIDVYGQVQVWDSDTLSDDMMGEAQVDLRTQSICPNVEAAQAEILKSQLPTQLTRYNIY